MEVPEDPLDSVIEEIATVLATGYLRLHESRTLSQFSAPPSPQATGGRVDSAAGTIAHGAMS